MPPGGTRESLSRRDHAAEPGNGPGRGHHQAAGAAARLRVIRGPRLVTTSLRRASRALARQARWQAAADLTRNPRGGSHRARAGNPEAARPPDSVRAAAPYQVRRSVRAKVALRPGSGRGADHRRGREWTSGRPAAGARGNLRYWAAAWPATSSATAHRHGPLPPRGQPRPVRWQSPPSRAPNDRICKS